MERNHKKKAKLIQNIESNYKQVEKSIVQQLYMRHDLHGTTTGTAREDIWENLFKMILPKKFVMEHSVFIIDSQDGVSHEVDLVIMDETYTPYIFQYGKFKFIPIEAVAAVVECKSQSISSEAVSEWAKSIKQLRTADGSIARLATQMAIDPVPTQKSTRPVRILCALAEEITSKIESQFDFTLLAVKEKDKKAPHIEVRIKEVDKSLFWWYQDLNFYKRDEDEKTISEIIKDEKKVLLNTSLQNYCITDQNNHNISLLSFNFQLNQLLMLINNPMLFPHRKYVEMFKRYGEGTNDQ